MSVIVAIVIRYVRGVNTRDGRGATTTVGVAPNEVVGVGTRRDERLDKIGGNSSTVSAGPMNLAVTSCFRQRATHITSAR
jgi:hypothetical protein